MKVFVYEFCCAMGLGREPADPAHSLYQEGRAMRNALVEDFRRIPGVEVFTMDEPGSGVHLDHVKKLANQSDYSLIIAPEFGHVLFELCSAVRETNTIIIGCSNSAIQLTSDKLALAQHWNTFHVPTPKTVSLLNWDSERVPAVIKPRFGAGSIATRLACNTEEFTRTVNRSYCEYPGDLIAQDYHSGLAASVAFLIGSRASVPLQPTIQMLSTDGEFRYQGGRVPIAPHLAMRAISIGRKAIASVPGLLGYVGVDLVLGPADDGSEDVAIEINPRPTTSYVGLREVADFNIAEQLIGLIEGNTHGELQWNARTLEFQANGTIRDNLTSERISD